LQIPGDRKEEEIVQLYIRNKVASVVRPVKELKDFRKISRDPLEFEIIVGTSLNKYLSSKRIVIE